MSTLKSFQTADLGFSHTFFVLTNILQSFDFILTLNNLFIAKSAMQRFFKFQLFFTSISYMIRCNVTIFTLFSFTLTASKSVVGKMFGVFLRIGFPIFVFWGVLPLPALKFELSFTLHASYDVVQYSQQF